MILILTDLVQTIIKRGRLVILLVRNSVHEDGYCVWMNSLSFYTHVGNWSKIRLWINLMSSLFCLRILRFSLFLLIFIIQIFLNFTLQRKRLSKPRQPVEMGTQNTDVDYDWLPKETLQGLSKLFELPWHNIANFIPLLLWLPLQKSVLAPTKFIYFIIILSSMVPLLLMGYNVITKRVSTLFMLTKHSTKM